jgi:hypothetical protein
VIGTTLAMVWPSISTTSRGKFDMAASSGQVLRGIPSFLRSRESDVAGVLARSQYLDAIETHIAL